MQFPVQQIRFDIKEYKKGKKKKRNKITIPEFISLQPRREKKNEKRETSFWSESSLPASFPSSPPPLPRRREKSLVLRLILTGNSGGTWFDDHSFPQILSAQYDCIVLLHNNFPFFKKFFFVLRTVECLHRDSPNVPLPPSLAVIFCTSLQKQVRGRRGEKVRGREIEEGTGL